MNERIKELAEQADWWKPLGLPCNWDEGDYVVSPEQMKKFAELIVKECALMCLEDKDSQRILEHFGVES